jgi:CelD/BcsL family acetyltransferase involved in cellulose biosynthesis
MDSDKGPLSLSVRDAAWLADAEQPWTELLQCSSANRLFASWAWQCAWWTHFGPSVRGDVAIVAVENGARELVALAPFYRRVTSKRRLRSAVQLAPIGNVWRVNVGEVTEHNDWLIRQGWEDVCARAIAGYLASNTDWDEILFAYTQPSSHASRALLRLAREEHWYVRSEKPLRHYAVDTTRPFTEFVARLGRTARLRLFKRRNVLATLGDVALVHADARNVREQLEKLERLSALRWDEGLPANVRKFLLDLSDRWLLAAALRFSTLEVNGRAISALFDVRVGDTIYNIRSAFDARFDSRISPGLLHLGYAVERACAEPGVARYELLAGPGKRTDYKRKLADTHGSFTSFQLLRRTHEKSLFKLYDLLMRVSPFGYRS